jgi:hypothetical protein
LVWQNAGDEMSSAVGWPLTRASLSVISWNGQAGSRVQNGSTPRLHQRDVLRSGEDDLSLQRRALVVQ